MISDKYMQIFLRDFAIAMIKMDFQPTNTLYDLDKFIVEFLNKRFGEEKKDDPINP